MQQNNKLIILKLDVRHYLYPAAVNYTCNLAENSGKLRIFSWRKRSHHLSIWGHLVCRYMQFFIIKKAVAPDLSLLEGVSHRLVQSYIWKELYKPSRFSFSHVEQRKGGEGVISLKERLPPKDLEIKKNNRVVKKISLSLWS